MQRCLQTIGKAQLHPGVSCTELSFKRQAVCPDVRSAVVCVCISKMAL